MAKHPRRKPPRSPHRRPAPGTRRSHALGPEQTELLSSFRLALRDPNPLVFLVQATALINLTGSATSELDFSTADLTELLISIDVAETTALLYVLAATTVDELLAVRVRRELERRRQPVPSTVSRLHELTATRAWTVGDDAGFNVVIELGWPGGQAMTTVAYIDHRIGTLVKDAFFLPVPAAEIIADFAQLVSADPDELTLGELGLADARATVEAGLQVLDDSPYAGREAELAPDDDAGMWPLCRDLLAYVLRRMPANGESLIDSVGHDLKAIAVAQWSGARHLFDGVAEESADIAYATLAGLLQIAAVLADDADYWDRGLIEAVLAELTCAPGVNQQVIDAVPAVLEVLLDYQLAHGDLTATQHRTVKAGVPEALEVMELLWRSPATAALRNNNELLLMAQRGEWQAFSRGLVAQAVGGLEAAAALDTVPLPDEPLDLTGVAADVVDVVTEVSDHLDRFFASGAFPTLDHEVRTACRRFLALAARNDPAAFRRRAKAVNTAATVVWLVGRANEVVGWHPVQAKDVLAWFGVSSVSTRADTLRRAIGVELPGLVNRTGLGRADLLVSRHRDKLLRRWQGDGTDEV